MQAQSAGNIVGGAVIAIVGGAAVLAKGGGGAGGDRETQPVHANIWTVNFPNAN